MNADDLPPTIPEPAKKERKKRSLDATKMSLKEELARRLSKKMGFRVRVDEILDRKEAAKRAGFKHVNTLTNGLTDKLPNYYKASGRGGGSGLVLYWIGDITASTMHNGVWGKHGWENKNLGWPPESLEPTREEAQAWR